MKLSADLELVRVSYKAKTYKLMMDKLQGFTDGLETLKQAIEKLFKTPKGVYFIYNSYGIDFESLIGEERAYVRAELKRMISESLAEDDRIIDVSDFKFEFDFDKCICSFLVSSIYGDLEIREEVAV